MLFLNLLKAWGQGFGGKRLSLANAMETIKSAGPRARAIQSSRSMAMPCMFLAHGGVPMPCQSVVSFINNDDVLSPENIDLQSECERL